MTTKLPNCLYTRYPIVARRAWPTGEQRYLAYNQTAKYREIKYRGLKFRVLNSRGPNCRGLK